MIDLHVCVNDEYGNLTDCVYMIDVSIDGDTVMNFELDPDQGLDFTETADAIDILGVTMPYDFKATMVGNVLWNSYSIYVKDLVALLNMLEVEASAILTEAREPLFDKWSMAETFVQEDFLSLSDTDDSTAQRAADGSDRP